MADDWKQQFYERLTEATEDSSVHLAQAANAQNVRRLARAFEKHMVGQSLADNAAALIATVAEFIRRGNETPGEAITLLNVMFQAITEATFRKDPN